MITLIVNVPLHKINNVLEYLRMGKVIFCETLQLQSIINISLTAPINISKCSHGIRNVAVSQNCNITYRSGVTMQLDLSISRFIIHSFTLLVRQII